MSRVACLPPHAKAGARASSAQLPQVRPHVLTVGRDPFACAKHPESPPCPQLPLRVASDLQGHQGPQLSPLQGHLSGPGQKSLGICSATGGSAARMGFHHPWTNKSCLFLPSRQGQPIHCIQIGAQGAFASSKPWCRPSRASEVSTSPKGN